MLTLTRTLFPQELPSLIIDPEPAKVAPLPDTKVLAAELQRLQPNQERLQSYLDYLARTPVPRSELDSWQELLKNPGGKALTEFVVKATATLLAAHGGQPEHLAFAAMVLHLSNFKLRNDDMRQVLAVLEHSDLSGLLPHQQLKVDFGLARFGIHREDLSSRIGGVRAALSGGEPLPQRDKTKNWLYKLERALEPAAARLPPKRYTELKASDRIPQRLNKLAEKLEKGGQFGRSDFEADVIPALAAYDRLPLKSRVDCNTAVEHYRGRYFLLTDESFGTLMKACDAGGAFHPAVGDEAVRRLEETLARDGHEKREELIRTLLRFIGDYSHVGEGTGRLLAYDWSNESQRVRIDALIMCSRVLCAPVYQNGRNDAGPDPALAAATRLGAGIAEELRPSSRLSEGALFAVANSLQIAGVAVPEFVTRQLVLSNKQNLRDTRDEARLLRVVGGHPEVESLASNGRFEEAPWLHPDLCVTLKDGRRFAIECDGLVHFYQDLRTGTPQHFGSDYVSSAVLKRANIEVVRLDFRDFSLGDDKDLRAFVDHHFRVPALAA